MSNPVNPLTNLHSYEAKHILLAFDTTEAATSFVMPSVGVGKCGERLKNLRGGNGFVVVNEIEDDSYAIRQMEWSFDYFSPTTPNTTISAGQFIVSDARGNQFPSFLRRVAKRLNRSETRITFYLKTVFRGRLADGTLSDNYVTTPLIFSLTDAATGFHEGMVNQFAFNFVLLYNTVAQLPNYSRLDQFTITNSENNPSRSVPSTDGGKAQILPRAKEDALNKSKREARLNKAAPMRTLKDVFSGFEAELKEMRFENKRQLQEFLAAVRPSAVKKIKTPKAKRAKPGVGLPITFSVHLDEVYHNYPVDNRNLMTEQTETKQSSAGITSLTVPSGANVFTTVEHLMKLSSRTGDDVAKGYAFKIVMSSFTDAEGIVNNVIAVKQYKIPMNKEGVKDTGPDEKGTVNKLELSYMDGTSNDVISLSFASAPASDIAILEEDSDDLKDDAVTASSQREQITFERAETGGFSGLRVAAAPNNFGLEHAGKAVLTDTLKHRYNLAQNTLTLVEIVGNPDLYSDLARNPSTVAKLKAGNAKLYRFPEFYPMYVSLKVKISNTNTYGDIARGDEDYWYHTYHYHLAGVTNTIIAGRFVQTLRLLSTDDAI